MKKGRPRFTVKKSDGSVLYSKIEARDEAEALKIATDSVKVYLDKVKDLGVDPRLLLHQFQDLTAEQES